MQIVHQPLLPFSLEHSQGYVLPQCKYQLFKRSFVNWCLFDYVSLSSFSVSINFSCPPFVFTDCFCVYCFYFFTRLLCSLIKLSLSLSLSVPTPWNSLPHSVHFCESLNNFVESPWNILFSFSMHSLVHPSNPLPSASDSLLGFWCFINSFTYLLTYLLTYLQVKSSFANG